MIIVNVKLNIKADFLKDYITAVKEIRPMVLAEEGCIEYELLQSCEQDNLLIFYERWESQAHLGAHLKAAHMLSYFEKTDNWVEDKSFQVFEVKE